MGDANKSEQRLGHRWKPGESGNPRGRAKSNLGSLIRAKGRDGEELAEFAYAVLRGQVTLLDATGRPLLDRDGNPTYVEEQPSMRERLMALMWLGERGWGKPDISGEPAGRMRHDLGKLQGHELDSLLSLVDKTAVREPVTVEADAVEVAKDATPKEEK